MRKRVAGKKLNRVTAHKKAMLRNMATSLFEHERIQTTRAKGKVLKVYAEKLITRAKKNLATDIKPEAKLHNKREILRHIKDRDVVTKLFDDIALRFKERNGGYTRMIHLPERDSDSAEISIIELVDRKEKARKSNEAPKRKEKPASTKEEAKAKDKDKEKKDKESADKKWYWRFQKKREK